MTFTYGAVGSDEFGLIATLKRLPSFGGLQLETLEAPGTDGQYLAGTTLSKAQFVFDVIIRGSTAAEAHATRDALALALDPVRGERWLQFDAAPGWRWLAILAGPIPWERVTWDAGAGYQLRADVTFDALEAYGRPIEDESWPAPRTLTTITRTLGNARSFPTLEVSGVVRAPDRVTATIGDLQVRIDVPLAAGQLLRLDWDKQDFAIWEGTTKVASVVRQMSVLDRAELWPEVPASLRVATEGPSTLTATLYANSRRQ